VSPAGVQHGLRNDTAASGFVQVAEDLRSPPPKVKSGAHRLAPKWTESQRFQEGQQAVVGTKPPEWRIHRLTTPGLLAHSVAGFMRWLLVRNVVDRVVASAPCVGGGPDRGESRSYSNSRPVRRPAELRNQRRHLRRRPKWNGSKTMWIDPPFCGDPVHDSVVHSIAGADTKTFGAKAGRPAGWFSGRGDLGARARARSEFASVGESVRTPSTNDRRAGPYPTQAGGSEALR
jgi:hypothetical protein